MHKNLRKMYNFSLYRIWLKALLFWSIHCWYRLDIDAQISTNISFSVVKYFAQLWLLILSSSSISGLNFIVRLSPQEKVEWRQIWIEIGCTMDPNVLLQKLCILFYFLIVPLFHFLIVPLSSVWFTFIVGISVEM